MREWRSAGLFDSGHTLIRPVGGRGNPRHDVEPVVLRHHPTVPVERFAEAFAAGRQVLDGGTTTADRSDDHRAMLRGAASPTPACTGPAATGSGPRRA